MLLASKNSYESKFTRSEIIFAFNKKPQNAILPYIIDNSSLPMDLEFVFAGINWRNMIDHPIDPTLVDDLLKMLGREREKKIVTIEKEVTPELTEHEKHLLSLPDDEFEKFRENGKYGFKLKSTGEIVIPCKYAYVFNFREGLAQIELLYGKCGFINKIGKEVIPLKYDDANSFSEGLVAVKQNGKWGYMDKTGKEVIPLKYDVTSAFRGGVASVKLNGKYGFIDRTNKEIIPLKYDGAWSFREGLAGVKLNGKYGFIDKTGKVAIPLKYDNSPTCLEEGSFCEGLAVVELNGKWGYIDRTGKEVVPLKYDYASYFSRGKAKVRTKNIFGVEKEFYIDKNGNRVEE